MSETPLTPAELVDHREAQATACLEAAATHKDMLLRLACHLAGSKEGGMELFQEACLNCHGAIQRRGYSGSEYRFYLRTAIKRLHQRTRLTEQLRHRCLNGLEEVPDQAPTSDARALLADQIQAEVIGQFDGPDRMALRLHLDGESYRDIAALVGGGDHSWIRRRVEKMKATLRHTFAQAWANLSAE